MHAVLVSHRPLRRLRVVGVVGRLRVVLLDVRGLPCLHVVLGQLLDRIVAGFGVGGEVLDDGVDRGRQRDRDQGARDARREHAGRDGQDHAQRVHRDPAAHQERLQHVALELLHPDHDGQHDQRLDRPLVDQRDQDGDRAGHGGADDRHERAEEDQHADGQRERHADDRRAGTDQDAVGRGHDDGGPHELGQRDPRDPARAVHALASGARREPDHPGPDPVAVGQEEVGGEEHDEEAGQHVADRRADLGDAGDDAALAGLLGDRVLDALDVLVDLRVAGVQRPVAQPVLDLLEAGHGLVGEVAGTVGHLLPGEA